MRAIATKAARGLVHRSRQQLQQSKLLPSSFLAVRTLSDDQFKKTLDEMNKKYADKKTEGENDQESKSNEGGEQSSNQTMQGPTFLENALHYSRKSYHFLIDNVREAYREMMGTEKESLLVKDLNDAKSPKTKKQSAEEVDEEKEEEEQQTGPSAIVLVKEGRTAWEEMRERLQEAPFIKEVLKRSRKASKAAAETDLGKTVVNMGKSVQDKVSDLREFWETSQNPLVYTVSGVVDSLTAETEEALAVTAIRKLDPKFSKEDWAEEVRKELVPEIIRAHLEGDIKVLKKWCGEAVYSKLAADISTRKHDGYVFSGNILQVDEAQLLVKYLEELGPVIVGIYMVQQINCIRNRKGEIIEGGETDIRAKYFSLAFQVKYDEDVNKIFWKVVDYQLAGDTPYL